MAVALRKNSRNATAIFHIQLDLGRRPKNPRAFEKARPKLLYLRQPLCFFITMRTSQYFLT